MIETFSIVRKTNPKGTIFSNVGADVPVDKALQAVELLDAQALQIHVNSPQELVMPEGTVNLLHGCQILNLLLNALMFQLLLKKLVSE